MSKSSDVFSSQSCKCQSLLKALGQEKDQKFYRAALELYCLYDTDPLVLNMDNIKTSLSHFKEDEVALLKHLKLEIQ
jgi:hypothetical protein